MGYIREECPNWCVSDWLFVRGGWWALLPRGAEHYTHLSCSPRYFPIVVAFLKIIIVIKRWPKSLCTDDPDQCAQMTPLLHDGTVILLLFVIISPLCIPISIQCPKISRSIAASHHRQVVAGLRQFIEAIYADHPGATTIEEPRWWRFGCGVCRD